MSTPRRTITLLLALTGSLALASPARAEPTTELVVHANQLAAGSFELPVQRTENGTWVLAVAKKPVDTCKFDKTSTKIVFDKATCGRLFTTNPDDLKRGSEDGAEFTLAGSTTTIPIVFQAPAASNASWDDVSKANGELVYFADASWQKVDRAALTKLEGVTRTIYVIEGGTVSRSLTVAASILPDAKKAAERCAKEQAKAERTFAEKRCASEPRRGTNLLCFLHQEDGWSRLPGGTVAMAPNTELRVLAFSPASQSPPVIDITGDIGFADPAFRREIDAADGTSHAGGAPGECTIVDPRVTERGWPALKPGNHTLSVTAKVKDKDDVNKQDIAVDTPYAGAIRIGVGSIFGGARDRGYAIQTLPGAGHAEIVTTAGGTLDAELVLGIAAYLERGGRTYNTGERHHWSPYFGIGLLDSENSAFQALRSLHLGLEYEISKQVSIAGTVVARKVERLADGLEVGDPATGTMLQTRKGYELGFGVVFNVSPEFLKIGKGTMSGFFK